MGQIRLRYLMTQHKRKARALDALIQSPNRLITLLLIMNNLVNVAAASLATLLFLNLLPESLPDYQAAIIATVVMTTSLLILGEITPKSLAKNHPERVTLGVINTIYLFAVLLGPAVTMFQWISSSIIRLFGEEIASQEPIEVSEEEIKMLVEVGEEKGVIAEEEGEMIERIFSYDNLVARQIMVPRTEMDALEVNTTLDEVRQIVSTAEHSRCPVYEDTIDNMVGILYTKDLLKYDPDDQVTLQEILHPVIYTPTTKPINVLLRDFQTKRVHMAIVVNEYGGVAGLITLEDILEEIVGEIEDEYDHPEQLIKRISDKVFLVDGDAEIDEINDALDLELPIDEGVTISGLILNRLQDLPREDETFTIDSTRFIVEEATDKEIVRVRIEIE